MLPSLIVLDQMHFNMQQLFNYKSSWTTRNNLIGSKCESMITTYGSLASQTPPLFEIGRRGRSLVSSFIRACARQQESVASSNQIAVFLVTPIYAHAS